MKAHKGQTLGSAAHTTLTQFVTESAALGGWWRDQQRTRAKNARETRWFVEARQPGPSVEPVTPSHAIESAGKVQQNRASLLTHSWRETCSGERKGANSTDSLAAFRSSSPIRHRDLKAVAASKYEVW